MKTLQQLIDLTGKVAIVTGGAKGIGQSICYRLAEAGASVLVADLDDETALTTAQELLAKGWKAEAAQIDVSNEDAIKRLVEGCLKTYGKLDILVNNAGIYPPAPLSQMTKEDFDRVMHTNLYSVFLATKYASDAMKAQGGGKIINITSIDALHPSMVGLAHYDASKHGVWGFTKNAALELAAHNIQVNAIAPGGIQTPGVSAMQAPNSDSADRQSAAAAAFLEKIPMHRMGDSDEIGTVALFMASDMASYMTGSQIVVDGGALLT